MGSIPYVEEQKSKESFVILGHSRAHPIFYRILKCYGTMLLSMSATNVAL